MKPTSETPIPSEKLLYSIADAAQLLSLGRTKTFALINEGRLPVVRIGRRTLIRAADLAAFADALS